MNQGRTTNRKTNALFAIWFFTAAVQQMFLQHWFQSLNEFMATEIQSYLVGCIEHRLIDVMLAEFG